MGSLRRRGRTDWWQEVASTTIQTLPDRQSVLEAERIAIMAERPRYNIQHRPALSLEAAIALLAQEAELLLDVFSDPHDRSRGEAVLAKLEAALALGLDGAL